MISYRMFHRFLLSNLSYLIAFIVCVFILVAGYGFYQSYQARQLNQAVADGSIVQHKLRHDDFLHAYSMGYLLTQQGELEQADKAFEVAEITAEPTLRAITLLAIGNSYFYRMMNNLEKELGSRRIVEQVILAREAYKAALRLKPEMYEARFNLELLDRLSPEKRTQGFKTGDGYTYQITPMLQDGRMHMKDNTIRGLP